jgi:hypothetical protein
MVATRDFSGLIHSACPLANAAANRDDVGRIRRSADNALVPLPVETSVTRPSWMQRLPDRFLRPKLAPLFLPEAEQGGFVGNENSAPHLC